MKKLCLILTMVLLFSLIPTTVFGAPSIEENAEDLSLDVTTDFINDSEDPADFEIVLSSKSTLKITLKTKCYQTMIYLYDSDGNAIAPYEAIATTGTAKKQNLTYDDSYGELKYDGTFKKGTATFSYSLAKGTYYIRMYGYGTSYGSAEASILASIKTTTTNTASETTKKASTYVAIPLKQGKEIQLSAVVFNSTNKTVTWKSNNAKIATVSSNGLVKAVGAGSTYISVTANDKTDRIYIQVTK